MDTLTLEQAAAFLHMHPVTLCKKAKAGLIPAMKPGKRWVFLRVALELYLTPEYETQALQGDRMEETLCHSTNVTPRTEKHWDYRQAESPGVPRQTEKSAVGSRTARHQTQPFVGRSRCSMAGGNPAQGNAPRGYCKAPLVASASGTSDAG